MTHTMGLIIFGFGGHSRAVADVALACGIEKLLFIDSNARDGEHFMGHPVLRDLPSSNEENWACMPASGDSLKRQSQIEEIESLGWSVATLIAPSATIGIGTTISKGCIVGQHAHIGPMATVGKGCIINTAAVVEHESKVGDFVHISVNATVAGRSTIGEFSFIGAGAIVIDGINICNNVTVGAGSVVIKNINDSGVYIGTPACLVKKR